MIAFGYKWALTVINYPHNPYERHLAGISLDPSIAPPLSVIVPVYNQESSIIASIISCLHIAYPHFELLVVSDGSTDNTLSEMIRHFNLAPHPEAGSTDLLTQRIRAIYRSSIYPQLRVIDKDRGGIADALNAGINNSAHPLFIQLSSKVVLHENGLLNLVQPFLTDSRVAASCGTLRRAPSSLVRNGLLFSTRLPASWKDRFDLIDAFRPPWVGATPGPIGIFKKSSIVAVGGYQQGGSSRDLLAELHRSLEAFPGAIRYMNEPLFLVQNDQTDASRLLNLNLSSTMGKQGWGSLVAMIAFEWLIPLVELLGVIILVLACFKGLETRGLLVAFIIFTLTLRSSQSILELMLEDIVLRIHANPIRIASLLMFAMLQNVGYRQIKDWRQLAAILRWSTR
jgi:hypothetical protein